MTRKTKRSLEKELAEIRGDGAGDDEPVTIDEERLKQLDEVFGGDGEVNGSETVTPDRQELTPEEKEKLDEAFDVEPDT
jgi:hypothetical protein